MTDIHIIITMAALPQVAATPRTDTVAEPPNMCSGHGDSSLGHNTLTHQTQPTTEPFQTRQHVTYRATLIVAFDHLFYISEMERWRIKDGRLTAH